MDSPLTQVNRWLVDVINSKVVASGKSKKIKVFSDFGPKIDNLATLTVADLPAVQIELAKIVISDFLTSSSSSVTFQYSTQVVASDPCDIIDIVWGIASALLQVQYSEGNFKDWIVKPYRIYMEGAASVVRKGNVYSLSSLLINVMCTLQTSLLAQGVTRCQ